MVILYTAAEGGCAINLKVFFVILGLLIVLCILCTGVGAARELGFGLGQEDVAATPPWAASFGELLEQRLTADDVSAALPPDCREQLRQGAFVLDPEDTCTLIVKKSSAPVRTLILRLTEGDTTRVSVDPNGENRLTEELNLGGERREAEAQMFGEGGTVEIQCLGGLGVTCRIEVE